MVLTVCSAQLLQLVVVLVLVELTLMVFQAVPAVEQEVAQELLTPVVVELLTKVMLAVTTQLQATLLAVVVVALDKLELTQHQLLVARVEMELLL
jgi:hypothetical protein